MPASRSGLYMCVDHEIMKAVLNTGMGSNGVPPVPHDYGTVSGTKLHLELTLYSGVTVTEVTNVP